MNLCLAQTRHSEIGTRYSCYGYDGHGNVRFLTDEGGHITDTYDYDPPSPEGYGATGAFGNVITRYGTTPNNYLYCGEQFDRDLGLYFLRARYMNTERGRFWTRDMWEGMRQDPQSLHKYLYADANPATFIDPSGNVSAGFVGTMVALAIALEIDYIALYVYDVNRGGYDPISTEAWLSERFNQFAGPEDVYSRVAGGISVYKTKGYYGLVEYFDSGPRYAFGRKLGFLDLQHVAGSAGYTEMHPIVGGTAAGFVLEGVQWVQGRLLFHVGGEVRRSLRNSAFRNEDLNSNAVGEFRGVTGVLPGELELLPIDAAKEELCVK